MNAYSTFAQFLQLRDKCCQTVGEVAVVLPKLLSVAIEHDDCGKSFNLVLLRELLILLSHLSVLRFRAWEIDFQEHKILARIIFKLGLRENLLVQFLTPAAPIRAGEIQEQKFVIRFGLLLRSFVIVEPARLSVGARRTK